MSTKEERDERLGEAMIEKIKVEAQRMEAETGKLKAEEVMLQNRSRQLAAETELTLVKTDHARLDHDEWFPVVKMRGNAEIQKLSAESRFYDAKAAESEVLAAIRRLEEMKS